MHLMTHALLRWVYFDCLQPLMNTCIFKWPLKNIHFFTLACHSSCNEGLMRCFGVDPDDCCQYYNDTMCVDECSGLLTPDENYNCVCPGFFNYPECTGTHKTRFMHIDSGMTSKTDIFKQYSEQVS